MNKINKKKSFSFIKPVSKFITTIEVYMKSFMTAGNDGPVSKD